eukprot:UN06587
MLWHLLLLHHNRYSIRNTKGLEEGDDEDVRNI